MALFGSEPGYSPPRNGGPANPLGPGLPGIPSGGFGGPPYIPQPPPPPPPPASNPGGNYGGGYGGGGGGYTPQPSNPYVPQPPPSPPPPPPSIDDYLGGDTGYQQQLRGIGQALSNFLADAARRRNTLTLDYGQSQKAMGDQKVVDLRNMENDYGSRGMIHSGLYGRAVGDYNREFDTRGADLSRHQTDAMGQLDTQQGQFQSQQQLQEQAAKEDAIRRRSLQYNL